MVFDDNNNQDSLKRAVSYNFIFPAGSRNWAWLHAGWKNNNSDVTETLKTIKSFGGLTIIWQPSMASLKPYENLMVVTVCESVCAFVRVYVSVPNMDS